MKKDFDILLLLICLAFVMLTAFSIFIINNEEKERQNRIQSSIQEWIENQKEIEKKCIQLWWLVAQIGEKKIFRWFEWLNQYFPCYYEWEYLDISDLNIKIFEKQNKK